MRMYDKIGRYLAIDGAVRKARWRLSESADEKPSRAIVGSPKSSRPSLIPFSCLVVDIKKR